ncbi:hypothetical protein JHK84_038547 [Glycine max]|nr:hypothetical protein JHK85_038889 [Glycine max]KAG4978854.1 hypothetical protein JHK86_038328 [Glycine max]KAG5132150.1 hypothetical protein JHK84_038547 [Glycine max]
MASNAGEEESTVIAIDSDRNSLHAVKWAVEHLLKKNASCTLIHIVAKELVLHDIDVSNALTDYIIDNSISNIVVGASRWNALIRKFKDADVATSLVRSVPETCTVHVISKGKVQNIRPAGHSQNISNALSKSLKGIKGSFQSEDLNRCVLAQAMKHEKFTQKEDAVKAWLPEEATLTLTEVERKKTKASMESAEMLKCLAEMKSHKGKQTGIRAMHEEEERNKALNASACNNKILFKRYNIKEIEVATNYFDNALKIGEGGYGPVFKGVLDHTEVAIKALKPDISQGERQFQQEVNVLSTIKHPNMVQLLGACPEYGCLVYEYIENGSLEDRLFQKDNTPTIPWKVRFKIASEIATGLLFLHQTKPEPVVHRDLKPANILLDRNYASKITDVGLARLVPPSVANKTTQYHKTTAAGTFCYIDPEYQQTGLLGVKSDIYSLGVMLLQIITGKPPMGVAHLVEEAIDKGKLQEVLDPNVTDWPLEETLSYARLALKCCEMRKRDRPDLRSVILPELNRLRNL